MTGYEVQDFLGHACRFLQWPNGGKTRESHPSNAQARAEIKHAIITKTECQTTLVNYRKNGEMFLNFVTIVPISWDSPEIKFWVGFQVDISEPAGLYQNSLPTQNISVVPISPEAPISDRLKALVGVAESSDKQREKLYDFLVDNVDGAWSIPPFHFSSLSLRMLHILINRFPDGCVFRRDHPLRCGAGIRIHRLGTR